MRLKMLERRVEAWDPRHIQEDSLGCPGFASSKHPQLLLNRFTVTDVHAFLL